MTAVIVRTARRIAAPSDAAPARHGHPPGVLGGISAARYRTQPTAIPFPVPVYQIEASSGACTGSIANLGIGYVGTLEAPMPVDVNCDLLPDVLVAVNLIDLEGPLNDPLATDSTSYEDFLADRLGPHDRPEHRDQPLPAERAELDPEPAVAAGADQREAHAQGPASCRSRTPSCASATTPAQGGSIPGQFKAVVRGLEDFFNPLEAVVDTKGDLQGGDTVPSYYEGPLTLIGGLEQGRLRRQARHRLQALPRRREGRLLQRRRRQPHRRTPTASGSRSFAATAPPCPTARSSTTCPGELPEVDMVTTLDVVDGDDTLDLTAALDRLPREIGLDFDTPTDAGRIDYRATNDGRLPDARVEPPLGQRRGADPGQGLHRGDPPGAPRPVGPR